MKQYSTKQKMYHNQTQHCKRQNKTSISDTGSASSFQIRRCKMEVLQKLGYSIVEIESFFYKPVIFVTLIYVLRRKTCSNGGTRFTKEH